jgi:hypothetical protein
MRKEHLEKVIAELERTLEISSGVMMGLDIKLEIDWENERLHQERERASENHKKMYNALIVLKKVLKGIE